MKVTLVLLGLGLREMFETDGSKCEVTRCENVQKHRVTALRIKVLTLHTHDMKGTCGEEFSKSIVTMAIRDLWC